MLRSVIVVKSAFLQKRPRNHGCTDLVRVNPIPCNVGRMTVLEVIIKNSLQIDKTAAIFFGQLTADCPIRIHTFSHPVLCIWLHIIWGHEKNTFYVIFYGENHLFDVGTVLLRRYLLVRDGRAVELSPDVVDADADGYLVWF